MWSGRLQIKTGTAILITQCGVYPFRWKHDPERVGVSMSLESLYCSGNTPVKTMGKGSVAGCAKQQQQETLCNDTTSTAAASLKYQKSITKSL